MGSVDPSQASQGQLSSFAHCPPDPSVSARTSGTVRLAEVGNPDLGLIGHQSIRECGA
ncbi:hypothetical protein XFF6990_400045 [Xanthomonas citri pv. fuscans]|nr:hypothetical protein XAB3213_5100001 [Xanthomonas citri pv. bilvae]SON97025.1 hypothetical protein XFF6990_400045 [Xanthomonas citri pv. fuscans]